jgi:hypothetical protein
VSTSRRAVFAGLFDDAAMFPPGNASAADALADHLRLRASPYADLVGPLLVPAAAWDAFREAHEAAGVPAVSLVLVGTTVLPPGSPPGMTVTGFEVVVPDVPLPRVPPPAYLAAEISLGAAGGRVLAAVAEQAAAGMPVLAKFRTGGAEAAAFPSEDVLAGVIAMSVAAGASLKLTAGLHHAVRHTDPATGFEHHGFLNVLVAFGRSLAGGDVSAVSDGLAERDPGILVDELLALTADETAAVRRGFVSFGCCGVEDPIHDLLDLRLIESESA